MNGGEVVSPFEPGLAAEAELNAWLQDFKHLRTKYVVQGDGGAADRDPVNLPEFRRHLRLGRFAEIEKLECRTLQIDPHTWSWLRLHRTVRPQAESRHPLADVLAGLARARVPLLLLVQGGSRGVHLALPRGATDTVGWTRSVLAPGSLLEQTGPPVLRPPQAVVNGLRYALLPGSGDSATRTDRTSLPGLGRLLLMPGDDWSLLVRLDPLSVVAGMELRSELVACSSALAPHRTHTVSTDPRHSRSVEEPEVVRLLDHLDTMLRHLEGAESSGLWFATVELNAGSTPEVDMLTSVAASVLEDEPFSGGRWTGDRLIAQPRPDLPLPTSLLSTLDVAAILSPPSESVPGLEVTVQPPAGRTRQRHEKPLPLGTWSGVDEEFAISLEDLEGHGFVTGTTGSGKSTTTQRLLAGLWNEHQVSFLVVDPVKADYEAVAPSLRGGLHVLDAADLRLNVLEPYEGFSRRTHLELVSNAFKGSFTLPSPVPYIVSQLFELLIARAEYEPSPTLHELRDLLDPFVTALGYDSEISSNIRASLGTRLSLLLSPTKAERLAAPSTHHLNSLFEQPTVVQLANLGDDEERAFLMAVLTLFVYERARSLGPSPSVRHVTVLEEAHRILPEPRSSDPENGDASSVSARLLTQMLAEIRSYGESVLVVDQSPSAVARDVVKNTNLKIAHKVLDPSDREVIGGSMGLSDERQDSIGTLARGQALILSRRLPDSQAVTVKKAARHAENAPGETLIRAFASSPSDVADPRPCCLGRQPAQHHAAERQSREAESAMALAIAGLIVGAGGREELWEEVDRNLAGLAQRDPVLAQQQDLAIRCLAWVGLRRGLLQLAEFGTAPQAQVGRLLDTGFRCWQHRRRDPSYERLRKQPRMNGPFYGCRYCDTVCLFRHHSAASQNLGMPSLEATKNAAWGPPGQDLGERLRDWQLDTAVEMRRLFGDRGYARGAALCAVTQFLHVAGATTAMHKALLSRGLLEA